METGDNKPVVIFLLGTTAAKAMPDKYKEMFFSVFRKMPYKFICQFGDDVPNLPSNVMSKKWLPQQDLLGNSSSPCIRIFSGRDSCEQTILGRYGTIQNFG